MIDCTSAGTRLSIECGISLRTTPGEKRPAVEGTGQRIAVGNLLKLARLGVCVLPPSPGFYQHPKTVDDIVDFVVARILDQLRIPHDLLPRWGE